MIQAVLKCLNLAFQIFILADQGFIILNHLVQKFVYLILVITAKRMTEFLVMYVQRC
ncbi:hypothetical protein D3C76_1374360 [compost metagenome]